ncbi:hypothetical protein H6F88_32080 [Oculatella sp. FACHB-28]|uniref:hypothetical protein n=1 Tax=Oculatella sp. FACHB-28 TaxID=2692845 RepID=UPI0016863276|nr:hypothetical protein [Oculatella sp. FACHB-28]MBD2060584.1 hypothetical protein [Oculatella sp. FACHB-28]
MIESPCRYRRVIDAESEAIAPAAAPVQRMTPRPAAPTPAVNPTEAWQNSLELGSFGEGEVQIASEPVVSPFTETIASSHSSMQAIASQEDARYEADVTALLNGISRRTLVLTPGTTAAATLTTPIVWAQDLDAEQQPQRFGLQLS